MKNKYYIYIGIMIGFLIAFIDTCVIAKENEKNVVSPKEKAIELAKKVVLDSGILASGKGWVLTTEKFIEVRSKDSNGDFFPIGWRAVDVSEGIYAVTFRYRATGKSKVFLFHVIPKDDIAQYIDMSEEGNAYSKYLKNIKTITTYTSKKLIDKFEELFLGDRGLKEKENE
ncbi:MAG: hypothetical protein ACE5KZ_10385 [Candidatus Scalinduaceae bacterium]